ncbi:MAG: hypothetical protein ACO1SV_21790 [Fimbriimonas sp.]
MIALGIRVGKGTQIREQGTEIPVFVVDRTDEKGAWVRFPGDSEPKAFFLWPVVGAMEVVPGPEGPGRAA